MLRRYPAFVGPGDAELPRYPAFVRPGDASYRVQPVGRSAVAEIAIAGAERADEVTLEAAGPPSLAAFTRRAR